MKRFVVLILAVLALVALWAGGWHYVAAQITDEAERLASADGVTQPRIACGNFAVSGFPFHFSPICKNAEIAANDLTLSVTELSATALFYRPTHLQIFATSPARLTDAFTGSAHELRWDSLRASLRLDGDRLARLSMVGNSLVHVDALFGSTILGTADHAELHLVDADAGPETAGTALDIFARVEGAEHEGFEIEHGEVRLDARIIGLPPLDLLNHPDALRLWQMADGTLTLRGLEARAEGVELTATGEASLDATGRLNGALALASRGIVERVDGLSDDPVAALFIGTPDAEGTYSQTLSVRGGTVFVGILPVMGLDPFF
ncbi:DUF2125 domain-containing protein [Pelagibacterium limicola]|uniref:DUF2125 domain-containing protein n=1 Tax=Pelagibacterium limicola TaxID=2791022 RepID=UPI0018AFAC10|nr:DUF2125 domain-containing protein [Pelagibacterium limicola]